MEANYEVDRRTVGPVRYHRCFDPSGKLPTSLESGKEKRWVSRLRKPNGLAGCIWRDFMLFNCRIRETYQAEITDGNRQLSGLLRLPKSPAICSCSWQFDQLRLWGRTLNWVLKVRTGFGSFLIRFGPFSCKYFNWFREIWWKLVFFVCEHTPFRTNHQIF